MNIQTPHHAHLLSTTRMTPVEQSMGRFMRAPDEHPGLNPLPEENNPEEKTGRDPTDSKNQNNDGQPLDLNAFWSGPPEDKGASPVEESEGGPKPSGGHQKPKSNQSDVGKAIEETNFGELLTPAMLEKFGEGDTTSFNEGLNGFGQAVMRQTLVQSVGIMRALRDQIMDQVKEQLEGRITGDRQHDALVKAIPSAGDPRMGPTIKSIYSQALKNSSGDVTKAIEQTKQVMQMQAEIFGGDLNLTVAPKTADDRLMPPKTTDWLESLTSL